jgi:hypothetical protein
MIAMSAVEDVINLAVSQGWIGLAIEQYESKGNALTEEERQVLQQITVRELQKLQEIENRVESDTPNTANWSGAYY